MESPISEVLYEHTNRTRDGQIILGYRILRTDKTVKAEAVCPGKVDTQDFTNVSDACAWIFSRMVSDFGGRTPLFFAFGLMEVWQKANE
jgi:hypothetical protein